MIIPTECVGKKLLPYMGKVERSKGFYFITKNLILYHISNFRTPLPPQLHDWRNLYDLPTEKEKEYCWKCKIKTEKLNCPECGADKFFMVHK